MSSVAEELSEVKKRYEKQSAHFKELQKEHADLQTELREVKLETAAFRRTAEENKTAATATERAKTELDIKYRHLTEVNKDQAAENRELQNKIIELQSVIEEFNNRQTLFEKQKETEWAEIARQQQHLEMQQKYSERKLEDDRNALQKQFQQSKHDLRRNFQKELESYRQAWDNQTNELKREHKLRLQGVNLKLGLRVQSLETDTQALHRKLAAAESAAEDFRRRIKLLERDLRREKLNTEVAGTSLIEQMKDLEVSSAENNDLRSLERKLVHSRLKITEQGDEVLLIKRQKVAADRQIKVLRREVEDAESRVIKAEASTQQTETRLTKRIEQLEAQLQRRNTQLEAEAETKVKNAQIIVAEKTEELQSLRRRFENLTSEVKDAKGASDKITSKMTNRLDSELDRFAALEKEVRDAQTEARRAKRELETLQDKQSVLSKELNRYKTMYEALSKEQRKGSSKNHQLEQQIRRLESRI